MADEPNPTPTTALAAPAPSPTPSPTPAPAPSRGISAMVSELTATPKAAPAPAPSPGPPKPAAAPAPAPEPSPEPENIVGEGLWRTAPKHLKNDHYKTKRELETKLSTYEKQIKDLEGKSTQSPADLQKIKSLEERSTQLEKDLAERESRLIQADYSKSDEFKRLYVDKGTKAYAKAIEDVKKLKVKVIDPATELETDRPATQGDFDNLRSLSPYEQDKKLDEMFGSSAKRVALHINMLDSIESEANEAITQAREKSAAAQKEKDAQKQKFDGEFGQHKTRSREELVKTHAEFFAPDPANPEASAALERGFKYVDDTLSNQDKMNPQERAETGELLRALAAATPRLMVERTQDKAKIKSLEEELAKYRKSAPGAAAPGSAAAPVAKEARGIQAAIAASVQQPA